MTSPNDDQTLTASPAGNLDATRTIGAGRAGAQTLTNQPRASEATLTRAAGGTGELVDKVDWEIGDVIDGKYEIRAELGRGGMGIVYKVHHREWDIDMAVKMPRADLVADEVSKARFIREAQTWVDLGLHPHIVQCWYVRELGGVPRLFVDFIPGGSLKEWIKRGKVRPGEWGKIIDLVIQACDGLGYAHERGVIHRDVKPANMLITEDARLCVTDFGLVKIAGTAEIEGSGAGAPSAGGQHTLTVTESSMGTPEYGAPEQWRDAKHVDARADIYALGIVLFELCVGRRPFDDGSHGEPEHVLIGRHLSTSAPDARELNKDVPQALAAIIAKCLAKKPDDRFLSMTALRAALAQAYGQVTGEAYTREPPRAAGLRADALNNRAVSLWDLGSKEAAFAAWSEALKIDAQHPESVSNKSVLEWREQKTTDLEVVQALRAAKQASKRAGLYLGYVQLERAAAGEAEKELTEALGDAELAKDGAAWRALGDAHMAQESYAKAKEAYEKTLERMPDDRLTLRNLEFASSCTRECGGHIEFPRRLCLRTFHAGLVQALAVTPDARLAFSISDGNILRLWELGTGTCLRTFHAGFAQAVVVTPDGRLALSGNSDNTLRLWDISTGECLRTFRGHKQAVVAVAFTPDGRFALSGSEDKTMRLWNVTTGTCLCMFEGHTNAVNAVTAMPDGRFALSKGLDNTLRLWELGTGTCLRTIERHSTLMCAMAVTPDGRFVLSGGADMTLRLWELATGACLRTFRGHTSLVWSVAVTQDGRFAVSGSWDHTLRLWELRTGACLRTFEGHTDNVTAVAVALDGRFAVSGSEDHGLRLWELEPEAKYCRAALQVCRQQSHAQVEEFKKEFDQHLGRARAAHASNELANAYHHLTLARAVSSYSRDAEALALNATLAQVLPVAGLRAAWVVRAFEGCSVAVTPDSRFAVSGSPDKTLRLLEIATGACLRKFEGHTAPVDAVAVTPDGRFALSGGGETLRLWEIATGACLRKFEGGAGAVAVTPDGRFAVSGRCLWEIATGACLRKFEGGAGAVAVTPDGRFVLSGSGDSTMRLWEIATGACLRKFKGHASNVTAVAVTPDGRLVVSGGDKHLCLWEIATGACLRTFEGHTNEVTAVAVTPDGRFALSGSRDKTLRLWKLSTGACLRTLEGRIQSVAAVAVTPNGRFALAGSILSGLRLWELDWELDPTLKAKSLVETYAGRR